MSARDQNQEPEAAQPKSRGAFRYLLHLTRVGGQRPLRPSEQCHLLRII